MIFALIANLSFSQVFFSTVDGVAFPNDTTIGMPADLYLHVKSGSEEAKMCCLKLANYNVPADAILLLCEGVQCLKPPYENGDSLIKPVLMVEKEIHISYMTPDIPASFSLKLYNVNDETDVAILNFSTSVIGLNENETKISVYPNPTTGFVNVDCSDLNAEKISIFDVTGSKIEDFNISKNTQNTQLDLNGYSKGIYFLKIGNRTEKIIVK